MSPRPPPPKPKDIVLRDFSGGMNVSTQREAIADNEAWWMEGLIPIAPGNLQPIGGPNDTIAGWAAVAGESALGVLMFQFNVAGTDYLFMVFPVSGNGYVGTVAGAGVTQIFAGTLTSGKTSASQWNNKGILIVDPTGYWDWNVSVAAALTALSDSVQSVTIVDPGAGYTASPAIAFGGPGVGAAGGAFIGLGSAAIAGGGAGYVVGDIVTILPTLGGPESMTIKVTTVGGGGVITGVTINTRGKVSTIPPNPLVSYGGAGAGATFNVNLGVTEIVLSNRGSGYTSAPAVTIGAPTGGPPTRQAVGTAVVSGFLGGTAIATYAGRAWIANGRTVTFTDVDSYSTFIASGSQFTINDATLHADITALYAANNYLYIFGDNSIDVLSNVTVNAAGTASFSRVNISAEVGCTEPQSIFSHGRAVAFANNMGFWLLSGATPECISREKLDLLVQHFTIDSLTHIYGGVATINAKLCAVFKVSIGAFPPGMPANISTMLMCYFEGRWFVAHQAVDGNNMVSIGGIVSVGSNSVSATPYFQLYAFNFDGTVRQFLINTSRTYWRLRTKLYDFGTPHMSKQAQLAAMGASWGNSVSSRAGLIFTVDTEVHTTGQPTALPTGTFNGYKMVLGNNNEGAAVGAMYMGWGLDAIGVVQADITQLRWLGIKFNEVTPWAA